MAEAVTSSVSQPWNIVVVVSDTLRTAYLGAYGNKWIHTPIWIGSLKIAYDLQMHIQNACQRFRRGAPCIAVDGRSHFGITVLYLGIMSISRDGSPYHRRKAQ